MYIPSIQTDPWVIELKTPRDWNAFQTAVRSAATNCLRDNFGFLQKATLNASRREGGVSTSINNQESYRIALARLRESRSSQLVVVFRSNIVTVHPPTIAKVHQGVKRDREGVAKVPDPSSRAQVFSVLQPQHTSWPPPFSRTEADEKMLQDFRDKVLHGLFPPSVFAMRLYYFGLDDIDATEISTHYRLE